jgi:hypothetical protein
VDDIDVVCDHHKDYTPCPGPDEEPGSCPKNKTTSADYALCLTKTDLNIPQYESVNKNAALPKKGDKVLLTGFGCNENGGTDGSFGYLFEGDTAVEVLPAENASEPWAANYIFTKGGAALCYGDSGGPSYKPLDAEAKKRVLIGVNSRSGMHAGDRS